MGTVIYEERLFSRWMTLMLGVVTLLLLWQVVRQMQGATPADDGLPWLLPVMTVFLALVTANFVFLTIRMTDEEAVIAYGIVRRRIRWEDIEDCYRDEASSIRYGGFGIRRGRYHGLNRLVYNTIGDPRVVLLTSDTSTAEFVFSTAQPEEVMNQVREQMRSVKR